MSDRFIRQAGLVPRNVLEGLTPTVIGVGAIGRQVALQLASLGVKAIRLIDFDVVDETNITTQGYRRSELGQPKVLAVGQSIAEIDGSIQIETVCDRHRPKHEVGSCVICCVDSISTREAIWRNVRSDVQFWCDGRMLGESIRILTVADDHGREHYPTTLFAQSDAQVGSCTSRNTIYSANIAAGLMLHQFCRWLRRQPVDSDLSLNLLASELAVA
jgi:molybdopterin-synthase adenylyltransferase